MGSLAVLTCSFSEMGRLAEYIKLKSVCLVWRRELLPLYPVIKIFHGFLKLSEMILDLKYMYLKFISFLSIAREIISKLPFDLPIVYKLLDKSLFYAFGMNFAASSTVQVVKNFKLS